MPDQWEIDNELDPLVDDADADPDQDGIIAGLTNYEEYALGLEGESTDPHKPDTDGDLINDYWEVLLGLSPTSTNVDDDTDQDGLQDLGEFLLRSDPNDDDTDDDGLNDFEEAGTNDAVLLAARLTPSDPTLRDTDADGLDDTRERALWSTIGPAAWQTDHDLDAPTSLLGGWSNLRDADSDNDGFDDGQEFLVFATRPDVPDTDGDNDLDSLEVTTFWTNPHDPASNALNRALTLDTDTDLDGLSDADESLFGTNPNDLDMDDDGLPDGTERAAWGPRVAVDFDADGRPNNLRDPDSDDDGTLDGVEIIASSLPRSLFYVIDPSSADTDNDGLNDWEEATNGLELVTGAAPENGVQGAFGLVLAPIAEGQPGPDAPGRIDDTGPSPDQSDTDADCLVDGIEVDLGSDPRNIDTDDDGVPDCVEAGAKAARRGEPVISPDCKSAYDADRDCILDVNDGDDDSDTLDDGEEDANGDGKTTNGETSPYDADTDDDGLCDQEEDTYKTTGTDPDTDDDGAPDGLEARKRGGCTTPHRADWTKPRSLTYGRETYYPYLGPLGPLDPNENIDNDAAGGPPTDSDSDGDRISDALEDWIPNGIPDAGEADPRLPDADNDGLPDGIELRLYGADVAAPIMYSQLLKVARETRPESILEEMRLRATWTPTSAIKTNPLNEDTDGDGVKDSRDIDPNGLNAPYVRLVFEDFIMQDPIDLAPRYAIDPYFDFIVTTPVGPLEFGTPNMIEWDIPDGSTAFELSKILIENRDAHLTDPSKVIERRTMGGVVIRLSDDVGRMVDVISTTGLSADEMRIEVLLGDYDMGGLPGNYEGRDESDIVDINGEKGTEARASRFQFSLTDTAAYLRGPPREHCVCPAADGSSDGNSESVFKQDDGKLAMLFENAIRIDFIQNALNVARNVPVQYPLPGEYGK